MSNLKWVTTTGDISGRRRTPTTVQGRSGRVRVVVHHIARWLRDEHASGSARAMHHCTILAQSGPDRICLSGLGVCVWRFAPRCRIKPYWIKRRRCAAPGPALPAPGSALGGPPGAPAPSQPYRACSRSASSHPIVPVAALASSSRFARRCTIGTRRFRTRARCAARTAAARPGNGSCDPPTFGWAGRRWLTGTRSSPQRPSAPGAVHGVHRA